MRHFTCVCILFKNHNAHTSVSMCPSSGIPHHGLPKYSYNSSQSLIRLKIAAWAIVFKWIRMMDDRYGHMETPQLNLYSLIFMQWVRDDGDAWRTILTLVWKHPLKTGTGLLKQLGFLCNECILYCHTCKIPACMTLQLHAWPGTWAPLLDLSILCCWNFLDTNFGQKLMQF